MQLSRLNAARRPHPDKTSRLSARAVVIASKALVIHGGLWRHRGVTLSQLRNLSHRRQCPEAPQTYDEYIFFDLLWSDPHPEDGDGVHESSRGDGCILFGRDMTIEFLRKIRSDQIRSDQIRSDQIRSDQIRSDQIRSDQIT